VALGVATLAAVPLTRRLVGADADPHERHERLPLRRWPSAIVWLGAIAFAAMLCEGAAADWSAVYLRDSLGAGAAVASLGYAAFALAMVTVRLSGDRLLARYRPGRLLAALAGTASVGFGLALLVAEPPAALIGLALLGGGLAAVIPTVFGAAGSLPGIPSGAGIAAVSACGWAGFVCGPPLIGQLSSATSLPVALTLVVILTAFVAVALRTHQSVLAVRPAEAGSTLLG
jgi:fucose permease